ncbi:MAG: hypothetical protein M0Q22_04620 [Sulfuritalea sp.]|jgi:hypothetical protein|nr:hypothetical protein [Sulfuritalea sp.]
MRAVAHRKQCQAGEMRRVSAVRRARFSGNVRSITAAMARATCLGLLTAGLLVHTAFASDDAAQVSSSDASLPAHRSAVVRSTSGSQSVTAHRSKRANFERERASQNARYVANWVVDSGDNLGMPFVIVDKVDAKVFIFHADGRLRGAAPALLGLARGDDTVPGIGDRKLSTIRPDERTTPSGRFVAALGRNLRGEEILWVDYDTALSMHRVITTNPKEHRALRLATPTPLDNRISYGCINVPVKFYEDVLHPAFTGTDGIVYVLPEIMSVREVFGSYDVEENARRL